MRKLILMMSLSVIALTSQAQVKGAEISIDKEVHDYGNIKQGDPAESYFTITNTGTEPLIISDAKGSCQCTVPEWPKEPIQPGQSQKMKVKYNSSRVGPINKTVTITSNSENTPVMVVRIKGTVESKEDVGTPIKTEKGPAEK